MHQGPEKLASFVYGEWLTGQSAGSVVYHAATGAAVSCIDTTGIHFADVLAYGREQAGPKLRDMTFHDRAMMLKALGLHILEHKEQLYQISFATGATRQDSWIDIEGGAGTLLAYSSKGRKELPNSRMLLDGNLEFLSKDNTFSAQHIYTPLLGTAVHINAYNFPVWGMLEKLAPTLLAGMPAIIKPASQTAYLTEACVRIMLEADILPHGALQLISGNVGDLLDHVTEQDVVTFTGSAHTGQRLKAHPALVQNSTRFTMEADSLNSCILGEDAAPDTPEFELAVKEVAKEMTTKAGQKCTAIRRVFVPQAHMDVFIDRLSDRLAKISVGLPDADGVRMGPVVSLSQRQDVRDKVSQMAEDAQIVFGSKDTVDLVSGDVEHGAFLSPMVLRCDTPQSAKHVHDVEAFGPVSTVMPYTDLDEAVSLSHAGKGSLVSSVFTNDEAVAEKLVIGMAPLHGRVMIGNRDSAKTSTGHGSPLPMLVHGGPGRAGGGEELGGIRGVKHFMQRTAVQGTPRLLSRVVGQWLEGAKAEQDTVHPFRKSLADLKIGDQLITKSREVTLADIETFANFTGDTFYAHMDEAAAKANPFFEGRVAHGYLIVSFAAGLFVDPETGPVLANYGIDNLRFATPVNPGDALQVRLTCKQKNPRINADYGEVRWDCQITNQKSELVAQYDVLTMVAKEWSTD